MTTKEAFSLALQNYELIKVGESIVQLTKWGISAGICRWLFYNTEEKLYCKCITLLNVEMIEQGYTAAFICDRPAYFAYLRDGYNYLSEDNYKATIKPRIEFLKKLISTL